MEQSADTDNKKGFSNKSIEIAVVLCFVSIATLVIYDSTKLGITWEAEGPKAGYFPFYLGSILLLASVINFIKIFIPKIGKATLIEFKALKSVLVFLLPSVFYVLGIKYIGIYIASTVYLALFMKYLGKYTWVKSIGVSFGVSAFLYLVFDAWFKILLPRGIYDLLRFIGL